jgi:hypothetical protein
VQQQGSTGSCHFPQYPAILASGFGSKSGAPCRYYRLSVDGLCSITFRSQILFATIFQRTTLYLLLYSMMAESGQCLHRRAESHQRATLAAERLFSGFFRYRHDAITCANTTMATCSHECECECECECALYFCAEIHCSMTLIHLPHPLQQLLASYRGQ